MRREKTVTEKLILGEDCSIVRATVTCFEDGQMGIACEGWPNCSGETLERLAAALKDLRRDRCDFRGVCADHGYHLGYECPTCHPAREAVPAPVDEATL
jgi:hypothetical protein